MVKRADPPNRCGAWCYRAGYVCDHNRIDTPDRVFMCSGIGGNCENGSKFEYWDNASGRDLGPDFLKIDNMPASELTALGGLDEAARRNPRAFDWPTWDEIGAQL